MAIKIHNFTKPNAHGFKYTTPAFELRGVTLEAFRQVNGGDFCTVPEDHPACLPGFRPYRCANGNIVGVEMT